MTRNINLEEWVKGLLKCAERVERAYSSSGCSGSSDSITGMSMIQNEATKQANIAHLLGYVQSAKYLIEKI